MREATRLLFSLVFAVLGIGASVAAQYERSPTFTAREVLAPGLLNSSYYKVQNRVGLENYQYVFTEYYLGRIII